MSNEATDQVKAADVFRDVIGLLEDGGFDYAVGGGLATAHWTGGASHIGDIDLVIREDDAPGILRHLGDAGYDVSEMERSWLHKAFKDGVTVDLMFELKNGTRFDDEFRDHRERGDMFGTHPLVMAPEDQLPSLAGTVDRQTVGKHWYEMIDLMSNNDLDWDYVTARSARVPLEMLSVVHFALSERVPVPRGVIERLSEMASGARR